MGLMLIYTIVLLISFFRKFILPSIKRKKKIKRDREAGVLYLREEFEKLKYIKSKYDDIEILTTISLRDSILHNASEELKRETDEKIIKDLIDEDPRLCRDDYDACIGLLENIRKCRKINENRDNKCSDCKWYGIFTCEYPGHCTVEEKYAWEEVESG